MKKEIKTRREALGLIGKTGIFLGAVPYFFVSLRITPESETNSTSELSQKQQDKTRDVQEKAVISGSGSRLAVTINGKPGRHYFVAVAASDERENYGAFPNSKGIINSKGSGSVVVDLKNVANSRIYVKVVTGETDKFDTQMAETEAFIITLKEGAIDTFEGVVSRPVIKMTSVASPAAACSNIKLR
jgi:hypothetical protein